MVDALPIFLTSTQATPANMKGQTMKTYRVTMCGQCHVNFTYLNDAIGYAMDAANKFSVDQQLLSLQPDGSWLTIMTVTA